MLKDYHRRTVQRAEAAVTTGQLATIYSSMVKAALIWAIPALLAVAVCWIFGLTGTDSLYVSVPLVALSIAGGCIYVGWVYGRALSARD